METVLKYPEKSLTYEDIVSFENQLEAKLPDDFISFYLQCNGGWPEANWSEGEEFKCPFEKFLSIRYGSNTIENKIREYKIKYSQKRKMIPFATNYLNDPYLLCLDKKNYGAVFYWDNHKSLDLHSTSFTEFLKGLEKDEFYGKVLDSRNGYQWDSIEEVRLLPDTYRDYPLRAYKKIEELGELAFLPENLPYVEEVLKETFERVAHNIQVIYEELQKNDYTFFDKACEPPFPDTEELLNKLEESTKKYGELPLSINYFYRSVGGVNFAWNYNEESRILWPLADPLQIISLQSLTEDDYLEYWEESMEDYCEDEDYGYAFLELSADKLHKDNISGDPAYSLKINIIRTVDSLFLNEPNETTFINYLRICFDFCGFPGAPDNESFRQFVKKVSSRLKRF